MNLPLPFDGLLAFISETLYECDDTRVIILTHSSISYHKHYKSSSIRSCALKTSIVVNLVFKLLALTYG
jgi:hypothetical protein